MQPKICKESRKVNYGVKRDKQENKQTVWTMLRYMLKEWRKHLIEECFSSKHKNLSQRSLTDKSNYTSMPKRVNKRNKKEDQ